MGEDLRIWLLGGFRAALGAEPVPAQAWHRSRATALVKMLALAPGHRLHREQLMEALWPDADPEMSAAGLRKAVHFARQALTADHVRVHEQVVSLQGPRVWTDVMAFEAAAQERDADRALALYPGDLLPDDRFEPWTEEPRERLRRRAAELLLSSARESERRGDPRGALSRLSRLVELDPLDEEATARLMRLHAASGQRHLALRAYRRLEDLLRAELDVAPGEEVSRLRDDIAAGHLGAAPPTTAPPPPAPSAPDASPMPEVRYARSGEVSIAYQVVGDGPVDLVHAMGWVTHLAVMWEEPSWRRFFARLASFARLILFDKRGTGMSDRVPVDRLPTLETRMTDVLAVMDAAGSERAALFGVSEGGPMSALFAATYPERTTALIMYGTYARRVWTPEYPWAPTPAERRRWYDLLERDWGGPVDVDTMAPGAAHDPRFRAWWGRYCQMGASPAAALTLARMNTQVDIRDVLPSITAPTLLLHRTDDRDVDVGGARWMARRIPGARYVELPGEDHLPFVGDQDRLLDEIEGFLAEVARRNAGDRNHTRVEERKLATIVCADVATPLPDHDQDPELLRRDTDERCAAAARVLESWGGCVERLSGGSLLAVFGIPAVREDDAARALRAAGEVVARGERDTTAGAARAGVETGEVVVADTVRARSASGRPVEVARRLCESAAPGTLLAGDGAWRATRSAFRFGDVPVAAHGLLAHRVLAERGAGADDLPAPEAPMVGRAAELAAVLALVADVVESRRPRLVTLVGAAGVGKSRLVREALAAIAADHPACRLLRGRCVSTADGVTDWALGEVVRDVCGLRFGESPGVAAARLRATVTDLLGSAPESDREQVVFALATTAGIAVPDNPLDGLQPAAVADSLAGAWPRFVSALAAAGLAVVVVEDLHWAGERLVEMLERIATRATGPVLLLATARPEMLQAHPGFGAAGDSVVTITLPPLAEAPSRDLLEALPGAAGLDRLRRLDILARADGNPYFLEELVSHAARGAPGSLPDSLRRLLAARVDALPALEKRVLQEAAVVGRVFWPEPVARWLGRDVDEAIASLERRGLVLPRATSTLAGHRELTFKHALLHDVAYASIPRSRRARAHAEVAAWMEELQGDRHALGELIAHHYRAAAAEDVAWADAEEREPLRAKAFAYLMQAGTAASHRYATRTAVELHERALEMAGDDGERLRALEALGDDNADAYRGDNAERWYRDALDVSRTDDRLGSARARLCGKLGLYMGDFPGAFRRNPDPAAVEELVAEGLAVAEEEVDRARVLLAHGAAARLYRGSEPFGQGDSDDPLRIEDRVQGVSDALAIGERLGDAALVASATAVLGILHGISGRYREMITVVERELAARLDSPSRQGQIDALRKRAELAIELEGRFEDGLELARRSYALTLEEPNPHQLMHSTYCLIAGLLRLGRWEEALDHVEEHAAAFRLEPAIHCQVVSDGPVMGAVILLRRGCRDRARELSQLVGNVGDDLASASAWQARYALESGDAPLAAAISGPKAREGRLYSPQHAAVLLDALAAMEDWDALLALLSRARADVSGNALLGPTADRAEGLARRAAGDMPAAARAMRRALRGFDALHEAFEGARTRVLLAGMEPDARRARTLLDEAVSTAERLGAAAWTATAP